MRSAKVFFKNALAGILRETESGYEFEYDSEYLLSPNAQAVKRLRYLA